MNETTPCLLSIAGSDSGGGAGIQADTKVCSALGVHCATTITSVTAQNTQGVQLRYDLPASVLSAQLKAIIEDMNVAVIKLGMLGSLENVLVITDLLNNLQQPIIIADPVIRSTSGEALLDEVALDAYTQSLLPQLDLLTPNLSEAAELLGCTPARDVNGMTEQAHQLSKLGPKNIVLKGGHLKGGELAEVLVSQGSTTVFRHERIDSPNTHGTGCYFSTAIGAYLLQGMNLNQALQSAITFVERSILNGASIKLGHGAAPLQANPLLVAEASPER